MEQRKCSIQIAAQFRYLAVFLPTLDVMAVDKLPRGFNRSIVIGTVEFDHAHEMAVIANEVNPIKGHLASTPQLRDHKTLPGSRLRFRFLAA
jgi:hypothetical protein